MKIIEGGVTAARGFMAAAACAEIKNKHKKDVAVIYSPVQCNAAGVFTSNRVRAACIDWCRKNLEDGKAQVIVANSGNANACTGAQGVADNQQMAELAAELLQVNSSDVLVASTGVIGVFMPLGKASAGIQKAAVSLSRDGSHDASLAIMTTDLVSKEIAVEIDLLGQTVRVGGIAKGSGMIHPNMATMLAFITTDAAISSSCLKKMLKSSVESSFNMISVDRETSTNDMAVILANGLAGNPPIEDENSAAYKQLQEALDFINIYLAKAIARDGEGAKHLIEVKVLGSPDYETARVIARSITASNLTKAAVFGADANWGRILAAAGYSGADFDPDKVDIYLGEEKMAENGMGLVFNEAKARQELEKETVTITVDLKSGVQQATAWGCDLSFDYVRINADYRT